MRTTEDLAIVICGEAGQGLQAIESQLTALAKQAGFHVFATKEYMSRVRGGCNSTELRVSGRPVAARVDRIDILIALDPCSLPHLSGRLGADSLVLGDRAKIGLESMVDLPFAAIAAEVGSPRYANSVAVGVLCSLLGIDGELAGSGLRRFYADWGEAVAAANLEAFTRGHEAGRSLPHPPWKGLVADSGVRDHMLLSGAEAVALGAVAAGCDYVCAYPMSPGTSVLTTMADYSKRFDIIVEQVEDEIGVANMALGAWYAGARALVTTSGGGFALMGEAISLSGGIETPLVIHLAQRPGPATGLPTRTEQGDLNLAIHAGHGDFLRVLLAPGDLEEGYSLTRLAFEIADRYQSPVFILTDQYYVDSCATTPLFPLQPAPARSELRRTGEGYRRYALGSPDGLSPRGLPGWGEGLVCVDSDEHDESGHITEDRELRRAMVAKRLAKIEAVRKEILPPRLFGDPAYDSLLVGWGSLKQPIVEALEALGRKGLAYLHFPWVFPLPPAAEDYLAKAGLRIAVEGNATGQFADLVEAATGLRFDHRILKSDGAQFSVEELVRDISASLAAGRKA